MASVLAGIGSIVSGGLFDGVAKLVDAIKGKNPEDAAKLAELLQKHQDLIIQTDADLEKARIAANVALNETAGQNIQAEAKANWYTASARPSVVYCWVAVMVWNYIMCGWFNKVPWNMPDLFWEVSGTVIGGYVIARGVQEVTQKVVGGAGGSVTLPFGIKAESKGD